MEESNMEERGQEHGRSTSTRSPPKRVKQLQNGLSKKQLAQQRQLAYICVDWEHAEDYSTIVSRMFVTMPLVSKIASTGREVPTHISANHNVAMLSPQRNQWCEAGEEKLDSHKRHDVYDLVSKDEGSARERTIGSRYLSKPMRALR